MSGWAHGGPDSMLCRCGALNSRTNSRCGACGQPAPDKDAILPSHIVMDADERCVYTGCGRTKAEHTASPQLWHHFISQRLGTAQITTLPAAIQRLMDMSKTLAAATSADPLLEAQMRHDAKAIDIVLSDWGAQAAKAAAADADAPSIDTLRRIAVEACTAQWGYSNPPAPDVAISTANAIHAHLLLVPPVEPDLVVRYRAALAGHLQSYAIKVAASVLRRVLREKP